MNDDGTVFILDDDEAVRDSLIALFEAEGLAAESFATADDFLAAFEPPRPGCLVLDVQMPDITGVELLERMAGQGIAVATIIITGHGDVPLAVKAMKAGALDFIETPRTLFLKASARHWPTAPRRKEIQRRRPKHRI